MSRGKQGRAAAQRRESVSAAAAQASAAKAADLARELRHTRSALDIASASLATWQAKADRLAEQLAASCSPELERARSDLAEARADLEAFAALEAQRERRMAKLLELLVDVRPAGESRVEALERISAAIGAVDPDTILDVEGPTPRPRARTADMVRAVRRARKSREAAP